eukprot:GHVQ01018889.1.p1 GENE.GHVQ01018889.1~~GHVQ01018889.1.p1  ORF type:complete len:226 (-),score=2.53 GHVQ01018889.1:521-1198(-)
MLHLGFFYEVKSSRLYVPPLLREVICYWFHASRYMQVPAGTGHAGVNKTLRRMKKWIWWLGMAKDVRDYINGCIICKRQQRPQPPRLLRNVLSKPLPLQMVPCDLVGPRSLGGREFTYCKLHSLRALDSVLLCAYRPLPTSLSNQICTITKFTLIRQYAIRHINNSWTSFYKPTQPLRTQRLRTRRNQYPKQFIICLPNQPTTFRAINSPPTQEKKPNNLQPRTN